MRLLALAAGIAVGLLAARRLQALAVVREAESVTRQAA